MTTTEIKAVAWRCKLYETNFGRHQILFFASQTAPNYHHLQETAFKYISTI